MKYLYLFALVVIACSPQKVVSPITQTLETPTESLLQAISIVDQNTIWISGHDASFIRTTNGGQSWDLFKHPTIDSLQFRDIYAFGTNKAVLMSAGTGSMSKILTFSNDSIWEENFVMNDSLGFMDCIDFWDAERGIAFGDAIDDYPYILLTNNGGQTWERAPTKNMPKAGKGEGGFAASGTCVTTGERGKAWIATGAGGNCRVLITYDYGVSWESVDSPIIKGNAAGNTSVSFDKEVGFLVGGDLAKPNEYTDNCAFTLDNGNSWRLTKQPLTKGAFYGGAVTQLGSDVHAFACGPNGLDYTKDMGQSWQTLDTLNYWAVSMEDDYGFVAGRDGQVLKITIK